ncbi:MAG TPA: MotA/TolQ/ExbB proton channel family protein [Polyangiaceae bacterium]|nr:MotA/TolQ/ExbB proton channel family protein [Polyangiaceae bacterium]
MIIEKLLKVALLGASWVMYLMIALSIFSMGAMVERWWFFSKRKVDADELGDKLLDSLERGDREGALKWVESSKSRSFEAEVLSPALRYLDSGAEALADAIEAEWIRWRMEMERGVTLLGTLGNNAPFIGLLGTVIGVIIAFNQLGSSQAAAAMGGVMAGIAEALVSTAVGLFVALPAVVAYNLIQKKIGDVESNVQVLNRKLSAFLKAQQHAHPLGHPHAVHAHAHLRPVPAADAITG